MPNARFCILTNVKTGERLSFETVSEANVFLGRKPNYIRSHIYRDNRVWDREMKTCYSAEMLLPRGVSPIRNKENGTTVHSQQLCWNCKKAVCGCSWSRYFKPIEGWLAVPTRIMVGMSGVDSYNIMWCPEFEHG